MWSESIDLYCERTDPSFWAEPVNALTNIAFLIAAYAAYRLWRRDAPGDPNVRLSAASSALTPSLLGLGLVVGVLSGFFGIGGGFLIVPGLMLATGMPILNAVGSSLLGVTAFGAATALNYAISGLVDWSLAILFIVGGIVGGLAGVRTARVLARQRRAFNVLFACVVFAVAAYMLLGPSRVT